MNNFKHKSSIRLRFKDIDMMGHVNNANYLTYLEDAKLKYFEDVTGKDSDWSRQDGLILGRIEINYKLPIQYKDSAAVYTRCSRIGTKSFDLSWIIAKESGQESNTGIAKTIFAEGVAVLVCYDYTLNQSIEVSNERKTQIEKFEAD